MNQYEMKKIAYKSTLKSRALQVLVYLIDRSNKEGICYPAISTMSRELHISVSTVKRALRELTGSGFVKTESRFREKNNGQTSNLYLLCISDEDERKEKVEIENEGRKKVRESCITKVVYFSYDTIQRKMEKSNTVSGVLNSFLDTIERQKSRFIWSIILFRVYYFVRWPGEEVNLIPP